MRIKIGASLKQSIKTKHVALLESNSVNNDITMDFEFNP